ncbi:MAG: FtsX-like permease family protein [Euryarchaeota archaeon]|nr:FtsX-like permease family protein [Euryarchaeota archaeon]
MDSLLILSIIVALMLVTVAGLALRNRILFKMGVRNFTRRPKETAVVIAGLLVSTAIISGSLVAGDTMNYMIEKATYDALGPVDESISMSGQYFATSVSDKLAADQAVSSLVHGIAPAIIVTAPSVDDRSNDISASEVQLYGTDFTADKAFGDFILLDGTHTDATDLHANEVIINNRLAKDLNAHVGDTLAVNYGVPGSTFSTHNATIKYIAQDTGKAQFGLAKNVFMPLAAAQSIVGKPGQINQIHITNTGSADNGAGMSEKVMSAVNQSLAGLPYSFQTQAIKQDMLKVAQDTGSQMTQMFVLFSSFAIIAAALLIVSMFVMLAEERKSELGMARAVGLERRHLTQLFLFEGTSYAVVAAALGSLLGLGVGAGLIYGFNSIISDNAEYSITLALHYNWSSLALAFLLGVTLTLVTIALASWRISKLNVIHAIRNTKELRSTTVTRRTLLAGALLAAVGIFTYLVAGSDGMIKVIAPTMAIFGVGLVARRWASQERVFSLASVALIAYLVYLNVIASAGMALGAAQYMFMLSGVMMVIAVILVIFFNAPTVIRGLTGTLGRVRSLQAMLKSAVAYPLNNRFRTGMTVMMFALVIFVIVMGSISSATFKISPEEQTGGYDICAHSVAPLSNLTVVTPPSATLHSSMPSQTLLTLGAPSTALNVTPLAASKLQYYDGLYATQVSDMKINGQDVSYQGPPFDSVYGFDANFTQHAQYEFLDVGPGTSTQDIWNAANDPHKVVVDSSYTYGNQQTVKAGDTITLPTAKGTETFTVAGVLNEFYLHGVFMNKTTMKDLFPRVQGDTLFMMKLAPGVAPLDTTYALKQGYKAFGVDAAVIRDEVQQMTEQSQAFMQLIYVFLGLGLIVGIASLGTITMRSILERRQQIGMMRAIGFQRSHVTRSLLTEGLFTAALGTAVGVGTGVVLTYGIYLSFSQKESYQFTVPWMQLATILVGVFVAAIVCIVIPARNAAKIPPAEAVRYLE